MTMITHSTIASPTKWLANNREWGPITTNPTQPQQYEHSDEKSNPTTASEGQQLWTNRSAITRVRPLLGGEDSDGERWFSRACMVYDDKGGFMVTKTGSHQWRGAQNDEGRFKMVKSDSQRQNNNTAQQRWCNPWRWNCHAHIQLDNGAAHILTSQAHHQHVDPQMSSKLSECYPPFLACPEMYMKWYVLWKTQWGMKLWRLVGHKILPKWILFNHWKFCTSHLHVRQTDKLLQFRLLRKRTHSCHV